MKTVRWKWTEGQAAGKAYDHTFRDDGTVEFREVKSGVPEGSASRAKYHSFKISPDVELYSYLSDHGFTLTVAMNHGTGKMFGFASNEKQLWPVAGTFEVLE